MPLRRERISDYVLYIFKADLEPHFKAEEDLLFPKLPVDDPLRIQAEAEHQDLYNQVAKLAMQKQESTLLAQFADKLENHIRFEERELFNHLQENISAAALTAIDLRMPSENKAIDEKWPDPFWQK